LSDWKYFENYKEYREKPLHPNRELEIHAFISLQHLIIARLGREIERANDEIFNGLRGCDDDEECDVEMLLQAQEAMHLYCELVPGFVSSVAVSHGWELLTRLLGEAIDDLENMLRRRTPHIDRGRRKQPEQKAYLEALTERGVELRLLDAGHPTRMTRAMTIFGGLVFGPIAADIGITTLLVPMLLIFFIPDLSKGALVGIIIGSLALLSFFLNTYSVCLTFLDVLLGFPFASREVISGKEILGYLAAYAAVLFVFVGAYLSPRQNSGQSSSSSNSTAKIIPFRRD
jgi:hypothetical protein